MNRAHTSTLHYHAIPLMIARRLSRHALLMVVVIVLLLSLSVPVLADTVPRFAYIASKGDGAIDIYAIDATTGALTARGKTSSGVVGREPNAIVVHPSSRFA